jgi:hypothetical protein
LISGFEGLPSNMQAVQVSAPAMVFDGGFSSSVHLWSVDKTLCGQQIKLPGMPAVFVTAFCFSELHGGFKCRTVQTVHSLCSLVLAAAVLTAGFAS